MAAIVAPLAAQQEISPAYAPQCPAGASPVIDSSVVTVQIVGAREWRGRKYSTTQRTRMLYYADAIRQHFMPPSTLGEVPMLGATRTKEGERRPEPGGLVAVSGRLVLVTTRDGRMKVHAWETVPLSPAFANAVTRATVVADSLGGLADMPAAGPKDGDTLAFDIVSRMQPAEGDPTLMRARIPFYVASRGASIERRVMPEYPENARANGVENDGRVSFIIGSDGRAVPSSVQVTRTDFTDFLEPMRSAVVNGTYRAGTSGGCTVPIAVRQDFKFRSGRR